MSNIEEMTIVQGTPAYLESPPTTGVLPPVVTLSQVLPFQELTWENFERLCLRLVRQDSEVEHTQLYGVRGQGQQGIDLYVRAFDGSYAVHQCKRIQEITPSHVRKSVEEFLNGSWANRAQKFVLCTSQSVAPTELADECEKQTQLLKSKGVDFVAWDREKISDLLKGHPQLVFDFFGKAWVAAFLGQRALTPFAGRLEASQVLEFRSKLRKFYSVFFNEQDPGIPIPPRPGMNIIPIMDRFVAQDVYIEEGTITGHFKDSEQRLNQAEAEEYGGLARASMRSLDSPSPQQASLSNSPMQIYRAREPLSVWLGRSKNSLITGGPGSGKSTLLRYLALEILTENIETKRLGAEWAESLPVWLPFAFWTKKIVENGPTSVTECARQWLESWSQGGLWGLVERALEDERLLLLVDGLDEAANEEAGRIGIRQLKIFVETHGASVITTSRPILNSGIYGGNWQAAELAGLSESQRADLCFKWFEIRSRVEGASERPLAAQELLQQQTDSFVDELNASSDFEQLSRVPLLLTLLMFLRFRNAMLPRDRFQAYEKLVDYLLGDHPAFRRAAASQARPQTMQLQDGDVRSILGKIAFTIQTESREGQISWEMLRRHAEAFLNDAQGLHLNLGATDLRLYVDEFVLRAKDSSGLLVAQGTNSVGFLHRALQEHLAAKHIASTPPANVSEFFTEHGHESGWREVILSVLWHLPRSGEVEELLTRLRRPYPKASQEFYVRELLTQAACTDIKCPAELARQLVAEAIHEVENHDWLSHRRQIVRHLMAGLHIPRTKEMVRSAVKRWIFKSGTWRKAWYEALSEWPLHQDVLNVLITALNDEEPDVQRTAAQALARIAPGDGSVGDRLAKIAKDALDLSRRAAALRALSAGWPEHPALYALLENAVESRSRLLRLTGATASVQLGQRSDVLYKTLVEEATGDPLQRLFSWEAEIAESLALGWKNSDQLKRLCLADLGLRPWREGGLNTDIAQHVLLRAFPSDSEVAETLANQIAADRYPFSLSGTDSWKLLAENFKDNQLIVRAVDEWATKTQQGDMELRFAAMVGRTPTMKALLLRNLTTTGYPAFWDAEGLLEGWGVNDPEVIAALESVIYGEPQRASAIARLIPDVIKEPGEARRRLIELLSEPEVAWPHFIVHGLSRLADRGDEAEIVGKAIALTDTSRRRWFESLQSELIRTFPNDSRVRDLALQLCETAYPPVDAIAHSYRDDSQLRGRILDLVTSIPSTLRAEVVDALGKTGGDSEFSQFMLQRYDDEQDVLIKTIGSVAYHRMLMRSGADSTRAFENLKKAISSYGPDHDSRRQAALAGAILLKKLDAMDQYETIGAHRPISVPLDHVGQLNVPLLRVIAQHWGELRSKFGETLVSRFEYEHGSQNILEALAVVAAEFPQVQDEIWNLGQEILLLPDLLKLLASVRPQSETLKERCLAAIRNDDGTWGGVQRANAAALIVARDFGGDPEMRSRIVGNKSVEKLSEGEIIALGLGWPEDEVIEKLDAEFRARKINASVYGQVAVFYARVPADHFVEVLTSQLGHPSIDDSYVREAITGPTEARFKRDRALRTAVQEALHKGTSPNGKATFPRLLARSAGVTEELRVWAEDELTRQLTMKVTSEVGFDLIAEAIRSVPLCLFDVLGS